MGEAGTVMEYWTPNWSKYHCRQWSLYLIPFTCSSHSHPLHTHDGFVKLGRKKKQPLQNIHDETEEGEISRIVTFGHVCFLFRFALVVHLLRHNTCQTGAFLDIFQCLPEILSISFHASVNWPKVIRFHAAVTPVHDLHLTAVNNVFWLFEKLYLLVFSSSRVGWFEGVLCLHIGWPTENPCRDLSINNSQRIWVTFIRCLPYKFQTSMLSS